MKKILVLIVLGVATLFAFATKPHIEDVSVNAESSTVKWIGSKVASSHEGNVNIQKGSLLIDHGTLVGGQISIDMNSIICTDIEGRKKAKLEAHLKDEDFFDTKAFPLAIPAATSNKTTSETNSFRPIRCARVPPICPAPIKEIFFPIIIISL